MSGSFAMPCHQVFILLCPLEYDFRERATALRSRNFQDRKTLFLNLSLFKVPWETGNTVRQGASDVCSQHVSVTPNATTCSRKIACILYTVSISRPRSFLRFDVNEEEEEEEEEFDFVSNVINSLAAASDFQFEKKYTRKYAQKTKEKERGRDKRT